MPEYGLKPPLDGLVRSLAHLMGSEWIGRERCRPDQSRHVVVRWFDELAAFAERTAALHGDAEEISTSPSGELQELIAFAIDVDLLQAQAPIPRSLLRRLRDRAEFQGARYEVATAALVVRAGLSIEWHDRKIAGPEFWATIPGTTELLAVEAKSRRRPGTLHEAGTLREAYRVDVANLLRDASKKSVADRPLIIFIDINLPDQPGLGREPAWMPQVRGLMSQYDDQSTVAPVCLVVFTNFAWHYAGTATVVHRPASDSYVPARSVRPLNFPTLLDRIHIALQNYGAPTLPGP